MVKAEIQERRAKSGQPRKERRKKAGKRRLRERAQKANAARKRNRLMKRPEPARESLVKSRRRARSRKIAAEQIVLEPVSELLQEVVQLVRSGMVAPAAMLCPPPTPPTAAQASESICPG